ncbi:hypothetical protein JOU96_004511 [Salmonella enterica]|nr:hypothetical protein [Salmonella enterica]EDL7724751.1 hypothetical protein [Salmonella enterica subsp. enterica serovar Give]ECQ8661053.1 hypothetical protein [Salmonella enterica]EDA0231202.1 hypothetical protein [Salmonella enterica]EDG2099711.1 hypothetical protein [Salmonella enterica]
MTKTLNPTITVTVSGPTGSGKSRVLAVIADVLKLIHSDCIIDAPDVKAEKEMCGDDHTAWHKPRSGTVFKLNEINLPVNTGRCVATPITTDDLYDRPVPAHIQVLMSKLGISFEEETDLQPVVDLVNWALTTPLAGAISAENQQSTCSPHTAIAKNKETFEMLLTLISNQLQSRIDWVTSRTKWEHFLAEHFKSDALAGLLTMALLGSVTSPGNHLPSGVNSKL